MFYSIFNYNFFEYFSEEILIFLVSVLFGFIITLCWQSTAPSPLNYNLWLVQIVQSTPQHRILRIVSMTDQFYDSSNPPPSTPSSSEENNSEEGEITNLLVIQTPNSVEQNIPTTQMSIQSAENTTTNPTGVENEFSTNSNQNGQDLPSTPNGTTQNQENPQQPETLEASQLLTIRLKFLDDTQKLVQSSKNTSIGTFKRQHFSEHLAAGKVIRLIFQGRLLRDDRSTLDACGLKDQCVVHCHIGNRPYSSSGQGQQTATDGTNQPQMENTNENTNNMNMNMPQIGARMTIGIGTVMNLLFMGGTYLIMVAWQWANAAQQVPSAENQTILARSVEYFRSGVRILLDMLFGSFVRSRNGQRRDGEDLYRFNVGQLLALLIFVKFMLLWMFVLLYPQFTDRRSLFLLTMLTGTTGLYFYFNRATSTATTNQNQQNNSRRMAE